MIQIKDNYYLDADSSQFMLKEKKVSEKHNISYPVLGYYGSISQLLGGLVTIEAQRAVETAQDLSEVVEHIREFGKSVQTPIVLNLREAIKQYQAA